MPFKKPVQKFNAAINAVELGVGEKKIVLGGQNVMPFYTFDNAIENPPRIAWRYLIWVLRIRYREYAILCRMQDGGGYGKKGC